MSKCSDALTKITETINQTNLGFSYDLVDKLKEEGFIDNIMDFCDIKILLEREFKDFIELLFETSYDKYPEHKKLLLEKKDFVEVYNNINCNYLLCSYFENMESYKVLPSFIRVLLVEYNMDKYTHLTPTEIYSILLDKIDVMESIDSKRGYMTTRINNEKPKYNKEKYDKYIPLVENKTIPDVYNSDEFFVWSEARVFKNESNFLRNYPEAVKWIAKDYGDGYGYDVLSYDHLNDREMLIEVKSGSSKNLILSKTEYLRAYHSSYDNRCDYYIYHYWYDALNTKIVPIILKFDKEKKIFINIHNPEDEYYISPCIEPGKYDPVVDIDFIVMPKEKYEEFKNREIYVKKNKEF